MNIGQKVDHVREKLATGRTGGHHCHWTGCDRKVPPAAWGCRQHWYMLPPPLRNAIWRAYRPGQEDSKTPSRAYLAVAREVQEWIAARDRDGSGEAVETTGSTGTATARAEGIAQNTAQGPSS